MRAGPQSTLWVMTFPLDPNAPGSPRRSEFVRQSFANAAEVAAGAAEPEPQVSIRLATVEEHKPVADRARAGAGV